MDAWIKSKLTDPKQVAAAIQSAKAMQKAILVDVVNKVAIKLVFQGMMNSVNCLSSRFPHDGSNLSSSAIGQKIESLMTNTKPRLKAYLAFSKALDGFVARLPTGETCD